MVKVWIFCQCFHAPRIEWIKNSTLEICNELSKKDINLTVITTKPPHKNNNEKHRYNVFYWITLSNNKISQTLLLLIWSLNTIIFCCKKKFDIIMFQYFETTFFLPMLFFCFFKKCKIVVTLYSTTELSFTYKKVIFKLIKDKISKIIVISDYLKDSLIKLWYNEKNIETIPISFDKERYLSYSWYGKRKINNILFCAWITKENWSFFAVNLAKELPDYHFIFAMRKFNQKSENELTTLRKYIKEKWAYNIEIIRNVKNMENLFWNVWSLIIPLQTSQAKMAIPVAMLEAMWKWTVCFMSDLPHLTSLVWENKDSVVIFDKDDVISLKKKILSLTVSDYKNISEKSFNFAKQWPNYNEIANQYFILIKNI